MTGDWCILECRSRPSAQSTLRLARSLQEAGYDAWTPVEIRERLAGRNRKLVLQEVAAIHPFVFVRADRLLDLIALSRSPSLTYRVWDSEQRRMVEKGHPLFSVFTFLNEYQLIADRDLEWMRLAERKARVKKQPLALHIGQEVRVLDGAWEGMTGKIEKVQGKCALVLFPKSVNGAKIASFHLQPVHVEPPQPEQGTAARAA